MIKAKKPRSNFLTDKKILEKIADIVDIKDKVALEIGPGTGNLTSYILSKNPKKFLLSKRHELAVILKVNLINK